MNNVKLLKGIILVLKDNLEASRQIKWIRSEQHLSLHGLRSVQITKNAKKQQASLSLCGQYFAASISDESGLMEAFLPFEGLKGSTLEEEKACKICLKMYHTLKDRNALGSVFFAFLVQVFL